MAIVSPAQYFTDPKEQELALLVWRQAQAERPLPLSASFLHVWSTLRGSRPDVRTLLVASDWLSQTRQEGAEEDIKTVNYVLRGSEEIYFTAAHCANVEHVLRAAYLGVILTPAASVIASGAYELVVDPFFKEPLARLHASITKNQGTDRIIALMKNTNLLYHAFKLPGSIQRNFSQLTQQDLKGVLLGLDVSGQLIFDSGKTGLTQKQLDDELKLLKAGALALTTPKPPIPAPPRSSTPPAENPADFMPNYPVTRAGLMLSKISMEKYQTFRLWPLIWKYNLAKIGNNPNKVPTGITLKIKKKNLYSADELKWAEQNWRNWESF